MTCTWKDCEDPGTKPQLDKNEEEWALLCPAHHEELDEAIGSMDAKKVLRAWARANNGHRSRETLKKAAVDGAVAIGRFAQALKKR